VLKVGTRGKTRPVFKSPQVAAFLLVPALAVTAIFLLWFVLKISGELLFSRNPAFTITRLDIQGSSPVIRDYIVGKQNIREGVNLFAFDVGEIREEFLRAAPSFKSMRIQRILPGTLTVKVVEREPLARIGRKGGFVVDREGFVFGPRVRKQNLPYIVGYKGPLLKPGGRIQSAGRDAVAVLDICRGTPLGEDIVITAIDVGGGFSGKDDDMQLYLAGDTVVSFWWPRRGPKGFSTARELRERLLFLRGVLKRARRRGRPRTVNLTLESYKQNCPVTFWN
jgi:hypothetical protein